MVRRSHQPATGSRQHADAASEDRAIRLVVAARTRIPSSEPPVRSSGSRAVERRCQPTGRPCTAVGGRRRCAAQRLASGAFVARCHAGRPRIRTRAPRRRSRRPRRSVAVLNDGAPCCGSTRERSRSSAAAADWKVSWEPARRYAAVSAEHSSIDRTAAVVSNDGRQPRVGAGVPSRGAGTSMHVVRSPAPPRGGQQDRISRVASRAGGRRRRSAMACAASRRSPRERASPPCADEYGAEGLWSKSDG